MKKRDQDLAEILLVNGRGMTRKSTDTKVMAHLPMLIHPKPESALVICFGMGTTYRSAVSHGRKVTVVELLAEVYDAFHHFYGDASAVRAYPNGKMVTNDGRSFLKLTGERFDVITVDPPPPIDAAGVNHLYSKEFLELTSQRLNRGGIVAHWIPFPEMKAGVDDWLTFNMLLSTFASVFPHTAVLPSLNEIGIHVLGTLDRPLRADPDRISECLAWEAVSSDLREFEEVPESYFWGIVPLPSPPAGIQLTTDDRPHLEFNLLRSWRQGVEKLHHIVY